MKRRVRFVLVLTVLMLGFTAVHDTAGAACPSGPNVGGGGQPPKPIKSVC